MKDFTAESPIKLTQCDSLVQPSVGRALSGCQINYRLVSISKSPAETKKIAAKFSRELLRVGAIRESPLRIGLMGDFGSGKTTFVQGLAKGLGINPKNYVNSPTFTLINEYQNLIHIDLYRIEKPLEGESLGIEEYLIPGNIVVIEWIERMPQLEKELDFRVFFEHIADSQRRIRISPSPRADRSHHESRGLTSFLADP